VVLVNQAVIEKQKRQQLELSSERWAILEATCQLLEPFAALTKYLEAESYLFVSAVQPLIKDVVGSLNVNAGDSDYAVSFKETAVNELL